MGAFHERLERDFPKTPDSFRRCVEQAVAEQTEGRRKHFHISKVLIPAAACIVLACGTVAAAELPAFQKWLASLGANSRTAEELVIHAEEDKDAIQMPNAAEVESAEDEAMGNETAEEALFTVTDAYYDGATLMFWAVPSEKLEGLELGDHVYINGVDSRLEYVVETEAGSGIYECKVTIVDSSLGSVPQDTLEVRVGVYVPQSEKQDFTFTIASDKLRSAETAGDQLLELSYGTVEVCDMCVAPSAINFSLKWTVYSEEILDIIYYPTYFVEDSSGNRSRMSDIMRTEDVSSKSYNEAEGSWEFVQKFEIRDFDADSEYMVLIPYEESYDEDGMHIDGTEVPREDMSFTIRLAD